MVNARRQRLRELIAARERLDQQIVALGGLPKPGPRMPPRPPADHGTESGYQAHRRGYNGWEKNACQPCRRAHAEYVRWQKRKSTPGDKSVDRKPGVKQRGDALTCDNGRVKETGPGVAANEPRSPRHEESPSMPYEPSYPSRAA